MAKPEIKAGAFTLAAVAVLSLFIIFISGYTPWQPKTTYKAHFKQALGLDSGTRVRMNGIPVGSVSQVSLIEGNTLVEVVFTLEEGLSLREGVWVEIASVGLIGDSFLLLVQDKAGGEVLPPGSLIPAKERASIATLISSVGRLADQLGHATDEIVSPAKNILANLEAFFAKEKMEALSVQVDEWQTLITKIMLDLDRVTTQMDKTMADTDRIIESVGSSLEEAATSANRLVVGADSAVDELAGNTNRLVVGATSAVDELADNTNSLVLEARSALSEDQAKVKDILASVKIQLGLIQQTLIALNTLAEESLPEDETRLAEALDQTVVMMGRLDLIAQKMVKASEVSLEELVQVMDNMVETSRNLAVFSERIKSDPSLILRRSETSP